MINGIAGVQAFFVLFGFLITTLLINEFTSTGTISIWNFIVRRTLRIFPLYILFLVVVTVLHLFGRDVTTWGSLCYAYVYAYNFVPHWRYTNLLGHTWSLAVEEHFYLFWPTAFLALFGQNRLVLHGLTLAFVIGSPLIHLFLHNSGIANDYFVERWSFIAGSSIAIGCLAANLIGSEGSAHLSRQFGESPYCLAIGTLLYANSVYLTSETWLVQNVLTSNLRAVGIGLLVIWIYFNQASRLVGFLNFRPLKYIGTISYGIYMYQGLFLSTGPDRSSTSTWPPATGIALLFLAAPLSYHYYEKPFLRLKERYSKSKIRTMESTVKTVA